MRSKMEYDDEDRRLEPDFKVTAGLAEAEEAVDFPKSILSILDASGSLELVFLISSTGFDVVLDETAGEMTSSRLRTSFKASQLKVS